MERLLDRSRTFVVLSCLFLGQSLLADELTGTVAKVFDGDSFIVQLGTGVQIEVRLAEIDAPEKNQPYANEARAALRGLLLDRQLRLVIRDVDRYDRKVARAYRIPDGMDINAELVRRGYAWVYRRHARDQSLYDLERTAREHKLGLWALPEAQRQPPWRWRREHPPEHRPATPAQNVENPVASMSR